MRYSVATPIKTPELRDRLFLFMKENYREPSAVFPQKFNYSDIKKDGDLLFDDGECRIGFNFNACFPERNYIFCVCCWMAIVAGKTKTFDDDILEPVPYYVYGGEEEFPVIIKRTMDPPPLDIEYVNAVGWRRSDEETIFPEGKIHSDTILRALESLNQKWEKTN